MIWTPKRDIIAPKRELIAPRHCRDAPPGRQRGFLLNPFRFGAAAPKVLAFQTSASDPASLTTYTFSAQSIGTAAADRRVIVAAHGMTAADTISSVTIGGVSADIIVQQTFGNGLCGIAIANVPTGTTADVVVTFSAAQARAAIGVWSCTGLVSNTAVDSDVSSADPGTATLTTVAGGFCIAAASQAATTGTMTWTDVTERYDALVDSNRLFTGADAATTGASIAPSGDYSGASADRSAVFATW